MCGLLRLDLNKAFSFPSLPADATVKTEAAYNNSREFSQLAFSAATGELPV